MVELAAMRTPVSNRPSGKPGWIDRALRLFTDVRAGEGATALLMLLNIFVVLVAYYVIKTVREPLILAGDTGFEWLRGSELKAYAVAVQALVLMIAVPFYSRIAARIRVSTLIFGVTAFFVACIELFVVGSRMGLPLVGFAFYVWVGVFNVAIIAQFWSFANDTYSVHKGTRLFPLIAVGATLGAPVGAFVAEKLFRAGLSPAPLMQLSAALLVVHLFLYAMLLRRPDVVPGTSERAPGEPAPVLGGFALVFKSRYLMLIAALLVLLNLVNTTGEYLLSTYAEQEADAAVAMAIATGALVSEHELRVQFFGAFYGDFFFWVNTVAIVVQAFLVSRLVKYAGITGVLFALPVVALGTYGLVAAGAGFAAFRWFKTAENATDYSVMNTAKALLWLPTSHAEKYQAKFTTDTFFVRFGDLLSASLAYLGLHHLAFNPQHFAQANLVLIAAWCAIVWALGTRSPSKTEVKSST